MGSVNHHENDNRVASALSTIVERLDSLLSDSTWRASATDVASLTQLIRQKALTVHEADRGGFETAIRNLTQSFNIGIITNADIAAMNDQATSRNVFEAQDPTLTAHKFGGTR